MQTVQLSLWRRSPAAWVHRRTTKGVMPEVCARGVEGMLAAGLEVMHSGQIMCQNVHTIYHMRNLTCTELMRWSCLVRRRWSDMDI